MAAGRIKIFIFIKNCRKIELELELVLDLLDYIYIMSNCVKNSVIELHKYYICADGNMKGIELYSRDFITINGPFITYDAPKRLLISASNTRLYLPEQHIDTSMFPPVYNRTLCFLESFV